MIVAVMLAIIASVAWSTLFIVAVPNGVKIRCTRTIIVEKTEILACDDPNCFEVKQVFRVE